MNQALIYLSGPVSGLSLEEACGWRQYVTDALPTHLTAVSPLRGSHMLCASGSIAKPIAHTPLRTDRGLAMRCKNDVVRASAVLVNLSGATRVSVESMMEVAWANDHNVPVVVVMEQEGNAHDHSMLRDCLTIRTADLDEAIEAVVALVSPSESLMWTRIEQVHLLRGERRYPLSRLPHEAHGATYSASVARRRAGTPQSQETP